MAMAMGVVVAMTMRVARRCFHPFVAPPQFRLKVCEQTRFYALTRRLVARAAPGRPAPMASVGHVTRRAGRAGAPAPLPERWARFAPIANSLLAAVCVCSVFMEGRLDSLAFQGPPAPNTAV